jgi:hypothetical protein
MVTMFNLPGRKASIYTMGPDVATEIAQGGNLRLAGFLGK